LTDKVPVLIWSNDRSLSVPHPLAGHTVSAEDFSHLYLNGLALDGSRNIVLFIQDKLSLCDITRNAAVFGTEDESEDALKSIKGFMSSLAVAQLSSVDNPVAAIADLKTHFTVESIHELRAPYQISDLSINPNGHNLIIVRLPETPTGDSNFHKSLKDIDTIVGSVIAQLDKLVTPFVAIYTATKSSVNKESFEWKNMAASHPHRQLLDVASTTDSSLASPVASVNGSFLFYADNITVMTVDETRHYSTDGNFWDVTGCENATTECTVNMTSKESPQLSLILSMGRTGSNNGGFWFVRSFEVTFNGKAPVNMSTNFVDLTPLGYSYHCFPPTNVSAISPDPTKQQPSLYVMLNNFQIQAFTFARGGRFGYYNDCVGFFSIPIWMGVISSIILIAILLFGVVMLMSIKTMDRFDDPKGKTITVTATD
jgi:V-type H+-transporting ATPase S1 subunit